MARYSNKEAELRWEAYRDNIRKATSVPKETSKEKLARIKKLEAKPEAWFEYYFPNYYSSSPAPFHIRASKRIFKNNRWYEVRSWSRELAKSTRGMMEDLYMAMTGIVSVFLLVSHSNDNAKELLMPYFINLESNDRLINDYGLQKGRRNWETGKFVTRKGVSFRALGAKESPRGTKNEEKRPEVIRVDDLDTDERCKNEKRMISLWEWVEQALIPTISISGNARIIFQGNLIAKNSIIAKASKVADYVETINIRDKNGKSTWPSKNTEANIDWILSKISYSSAQKEYYNNPIKMGTVFKDIIWGKIPAYSRLKFLVAYGDPSPSNQETKKNSHKTVILLGKYKSTYYIVNAWLEQTTNTKFIEWYHEADDYVNDRAPIYNLMENNGFQDPFYQQVYQPLMISVGKVRGTMIHIAPDSRRKPDKFTRIEAGLEPIHRTGNLIFNIAEKNNPHMIRLEDQFLAIDPELSAPADGPDGVEGAKWVIDKKNYTGTMTLCDRTGTYTNNKRY